MSFTTAALLRPLLLLLFLFGSTLSFSCYAAHHTLHRAVHHHPLRHRKARAHPHLQRHKKSRALHHRLHKHLDKIRLAKQIVVHKAIRELGKPYVYGGSSPRTGFDCSGLVYFIYRDLFTPHLPRTANRMFHMHSARQIRREQLQTGDLVFFHIHSPQHQHADHVGIYLGKNRFIQAPHTGSTIRISSLQNHYWQKHYLGARRLLEEPKIHLDLAPDQRWG